jgi:integrase
MRQRKIRVLQYRDGNRPHLKFIVNYREAGKRKRSFFESKQQADSFVAFKNAELKRNGVEGAEFPTSLRVMAQNAVEQLMPFGKTITDAVGYYVAHLKAIDRSCTVAQLVKELLAAKEADGASQHHLHDLHYRLGVFAKTFDSKPVASITAAEIDDWLRSLPVSALSRNNYRQRVMLAFNFAVRRGYATTNPATGAAKAKVVQKPPGILAFAEAARFLEAAAPQILPYIAIGLFAGLRRAELERLDWSEVDFESNLIQVAAAKSKTAQRRFVKIQPNLREWLLPVRKHKGSVTPQENSRQLFDQARVAAGIPKWQRNALRHSFASYHLAHFNDAAATALQLGHHDSRVTFAHYRELVRPKEAQRYWNLFPSVAASSKVVSIST